MIGAAQCPASRFTRTNGQAGHRTLPPGPEITHAEGDQASERSPRTPFARPHTSVSIDAQSTAPERAASPIRGVTWWQRSRRRSAMRVWTRALHLVVCFRLRAVSSPWPRSLRKSDSAAQAAPRTSCRGAQHGRTAIQSSWASSRCRTPRKDACSKSGSPCAHPSAATRACRRIVLRAPPSPA